MPGRSAQEHFTLPRTVSTMASLSKLLLNLHQGLLASDAAAAQRAEVATVVAARCCPHVAQAADGWQGDLAADKREEACWHAANALRDYIQALSASPAFSCQAACSQRGPRIPGKRAVAAVIEAVQLVAEALQAVVGVPSLRAMRLSDEGGVSLPATVYSILTHVAISFLGQELPGRQVRLTSCIDGELVFPMVLALLSLLCGQVRWDQGITMPCC